MDFKRHDLESAPEAAKPLLEQSQKTMGMIPEMLRVMAEAPGLLAAYQQLHALFSQSSFDAAELTVVWQTINVEHDCHYCVPAHTGIAQMMKVPEAITEALRNETPLPDARLEALRTFTLAVVRKRGDVSGEDLDAFYQAGYGQRQVLEVILGVSQKVMSNYVNRIVATPVDEPFRRYAWTRSA